MDSSERKRREISEMPPDSSSGDVDGEDIISTLPDSIRCHILSKLPTKFAVGTSILSSEWRHLFPCIPNLRIDIEDNQLLHPPDADGATDQSICNTSFINFIHHLFNVTLRDVPRISDLCLHFHHDYGTGNTTIKELISSASRFQVSYLYLEFTVDGWGVSLDDLRNYTSLDSLSLSQEYPLHVRNPLGFPNLTRLFIHATSFFQSDGLERALNACPLLEDLALDRCHFPVSAVLRISVPNLKFLFIWECYYDDEYKIVIHTPLLEYLSYNDTVAEGYSLVDYSSLQRAHVQLGLNNDQFEEHDKSVYYENIAEMIRACHKVTHLFLGRSSISCLQSSSGAIHSLPIYWNLIELSLGNLDVKGWETLPHLLQKSPNLQSLIFEKGIKEHTGCYSRFQSCFPDSVPPCLSSHLLKIKFEEFKGEEDELKLVGYFLRTAAVLVEMKVCLLISLPIEEMKRIWTSIKALPRCSESCSLQYM